MSIKIQHIHKKYKNTHALKDISLDINSGMFGLLGPNGAGKTTLMRLIMGLHQQTEGVIEVFGIPTSDREAIRQMISYLPQEYTFYPNMTVYEAMDYMAILCDVKDKRNRQELIQKLLQDVNLYTERKKRVKSLSGGMKRRLGLAQALIKNPRVLIVDEPTAGLDPEERLRIRNLLSAFSKERIVIFSTHIVEDIAFSCQHLAVISEGSIVYNGSIDALLKQADGAVWQSDISHAALDDLQAKYHVTRVTPYQSHVTIKVIGKDLHLGEKISPTLEDAYMYLMKRSDHDKISA